MKHIRKPTPVHGGKLPGIPHHSKAEADSTEVYAQGGDATGAKPVYGPKDNNNHKPAARKTLGAPDAQDSVVSADEEAAINGTSGNYKKG